MRSVFEAACGFGERGRTRAEMFAGKVAYVGEDGGRGVGGGIGRGGRGGGGGGGEDDKPSAGKKGKPPGDDVEGSVRGGACER